MRLAVDAALQGPAQRGELVFDALDGVVPRRRVSDDPTSPQAAAADLELRFHERDEMPPCPAPALGRADDLREADKGTVDNDEVDEAGDVFG